VTIRLASAADEQHLLRLAALDSAELPQGTLLLAEIDHGVVAAVALTGGAVVADPFRRTTDVVALLRLRVGQLRRNDANPKGGRFRLIRRRAPRNVWPRTASAV
jgi:hypothetical protein